MYHRTRHTFLTSVFVCTVSTNGLFSGANSTTTFIKEGPRASQHCPPARPPGRSSNCYRAHSIPSSCCCPWHYQDTLSFLPSVDYPGNRCAIADLLPAGRWAQPSLELWEHLASCHPVSTGLSLFRQAISRSPGLGPPQSLPFLHKGAGDWEARCPFIHVSGLNCLLSAPLSGLGPTLTQSWSACCGRPGWTSSKETAPDWTA